MTSKVDDTCKYVAKCRFCGTSIYTDSKVHECSACGSNDVVCTSVQKYETELAKKACLYTVSSLANTKKKAAEPKTKKAFKFKKLNWIKLLKISIVVGYAVAVAASIAAKFV